MGYTPGVLTAATADMTVTLLLATARRLLEGGNFLAGQVSSDLSLLHFAELFLNPGNAALKAGQWSAWSPLWMCGWVVPGHITIMSMSIMPGHMVRLPNPLALGLHRYMSVGEPD